MKNLILDFLRLVRYQNLLMIILAQYLMRWCIIGPILQANGLELQMSESIFGLLVLATVLIAAGGNIINDYFDQKTDLINKPQRVIIDKSIDRRAAMVWHMALNFVALLIGAYISYKIGKITFASIFLIISGLLYFYSTTYKWQFLLGNVIISGLIGIVPVIVLFFEIPLLNRAYSQAVLFQQVEFKGIASIVIAFGGFAFIVNLIRELVKDMEDMEGDKRVSKGTVPLTVGVRATKYIIHGISVVTIALLFFVYFNYLIYINKTDSIEFVSLIYLVVTVCFPIVLFNIFLMKAKASEDFYRLSGMLKIIMLLGLLYAVVFNILINYYY